MYIVTDSNSRVIEIYERYSEGTIAVDWNPEENLMDERYVYRYKYMDGEVFERTQEEMDEDCTSSIIKPSIDDRITVLESKLNAFEIAYTAGVNEV